MPPFTVLSNRYMVGKVLGKGGFGITYVAMDFKRNRICAIKEYMPTEYSRRDSGMNSINPFEDKKSVYVFKHGREKFVEEAKTLYQLKDNPIIVDIIDFFYENNTAYLVMEYLDGSDLRKMVKARGGTVDAEFAKAVFVTIASALTVVHRKNILHRDLSPENIFITNNNEIKLIDFGAARNYVSNQNKGMSILLKPGFAPPEQYSSDGVQGPWTDVYGLCATFYNIVSGKKLIDAMYRYRGQKQPSLYEMGCSVSKVTSDVIEKGMELDYKKRYRDFSELLREIDIDCGNNNIVKNVKKQSVTDNKTQETADKQKTAVNSSASTVKQVGSYSPWAGLVENGRIVKKMRIQPDTDFLIGRSAEKSNFTVDGDSNISRVHCTVRFNSAEGMFLITDKSVNGTYLGDGSRMKPGAVYRVRPDCVLYLVTSAHQIVLYCGK